MGFLSALGSGLASVFSGAVSSAGQLFVNNANIKQQRANNALAVDLANTAHQREVADLKAAGLNPILSASGAGSEVPSLGVASQINPATGIADGISSAASLYTPEKRATVENIKANTEKAKADADAAGASSAASFLQAKTQAMLGQQELRNKQVQEKILEADRFSRESSAISESLRESAYMQALTGKMEQSTRDLIDWDDKEAVQTYDNLVQKYRNQIEKERYLEAVEREYVRDGINSAESLTDIGVGVKKIMKSAKKGKRR